MPDVVTRMDIDRIKNFISNFGWKISKQKVTEKEIELVIEKQLIPLTEAEPSK